MIAWLKRFSERRRERRKQRLLLELKLLRAELEYRRERLQEDQHFFARSQGTEGLDELRRLIDRNALLFWDWRAKQMLDLAFQRDKVRALQEEHHRIEIQILALN